MGFTFPDWSLVSPVTSSSSSSYKALGFLLVQQCKFEMDCTFSDWSLGAMGKETRGEVRRVLRAWVSKSPLILYSPGPGKRPLPSLGLCTCLGKLHTHIHNLAEKGF